MAVITLLLFLSFSLARAAQSVTLAWNASPSAGVTGYKVYYGTVAGSPSASINVGNVTTATVSNLNDATTYFFSVAAYNSAGLESQRSSEISYTTGSPAPNTYRLTVNNGSGDGTYTLGTSVIVTADPPAQGQQFAGWQGDTAILDDFTSSPTEALIISRDVVITAAYSALPTYTVTVTNGTGDGNYYAGAQVTIVADAPPAGQQFTGWTGNANYASASSPTTTFTMPSSAVVVTATYSAGTGTGGTGLRGQYYNDSSSAAYPLANPFAGSAVLTRTDAIVDFNWADSSPGSPVNSDHFSVKWTGQVKAPVSGNYTFRVIGDDGVRLFINGVKVIDGWKDQGAAPYSYTTTLTAGTSYSIELHYYENAGTSECRLHWSYPGQADQAIPQSRLYPVAGQAPPAPTTYTLTVINGSGDGVYPAGARVAVQGNLTGPGGWFDDWSGDTEYLDDPSDRTTTITMPSAPVTISATFD